MKCFSVSSHSRGGKIAFKILPAACLLCNGSNLALDYFPPTSIYVNKMELITTRAEGSDELGLVTSDLKQKKECKIFGSVKRLLLRLDQNI